MKDKLHEFEGRDLRVTWSKARCIHAAACVFGLPTVFEPGRRPWITPDDASADKVAEIVRRCPTGALHFERTDGGVPESPPETNTIVSSKFGPLYVKGDVELLAADGSVVLKDTRLALCRCGDSRNKPFCDGTHSSAGFRDPGDVFEGGVKTEGGGAEHRPLSVTVSEAGPLKVSGPFTLLSADGRMRLAGDTVSLCRCGGSRNKPFCDGSHATSDKLGD